MYTCIILGLSLYLSTVPQFSQMIFASFCFACHFSLCLFYPWHAGYAYCSFLGHFTGEIDCPILFQRQVHGSAQHALFFLRTGALAGAGHQRHSLLLALLKDLPLSGPPFEDRQCQSLFVLGHCAPEFGTTVKPGATKLYLTPAASVIDTMVTYRGVCSGVQQAAFCKDAWFMLFNVLHAPHCRALAGAGHLGRSCK